MQTLPAELLGRVIGFLDSPEDRCALSCCSRFLHACVEQEWDSAALRVGIRAPRLCARRHLVSSRLCRQQFSSVILEGSLDRASSLFCAKGDEILFDIGTHLPGLASETVSVTSTMARARTDVFPSDASGVTRVKAASKSRAIELDVYASGFVKLRLTLREVRMPPGGSFEVLPSAVLQKLLPTQHAPTLDLFRCTNGFMYRTELRISTGIVGHNSWSMTTAVPCSFGRVSLCPPSDQMHKSLEYWPDGTVVHRSSEHFAFHRRTNEPLSISIAPKELYLAFSRCIWRERPGQFLVDCKGCEAVAEEPSAKRQKTSAD